MISTAIICMHNYVTDTHQHATMYQCCAIHNEYPLVLVQSFGC